MTSKEALNWLDAIINKPEVCGGNLEDNNNALNQIEKDLELLESIKEVFKKVTYEPEYSYEEEDENGRGRAKGYLDLYIDQYIEKSRAAHQLFKEINKKLEESK